MAKLTASAGMAEISNGGLIFKPSQVYLLGMLPLLINAKLVTPNTFIDISFAN